MLRCVLQSATEVNPNSCLEKRLTAWSVDSVPSTAWRDYFVEMWMLCVEFISALNHCDWYMLVSFLAHLQSRVLRAALLDDPLKRLKNNTMKTDIDISLLRYMSAILWRDYDLHLRLRWSFEDCLVLQWAGCVEEIEGCLVEELCGGYLCGE